MSVCQSCNQEMLTAKGCTFTWLAYKDKTKKIYKRIKCGSPDDLFGGEEPQERCHDCGAKVGGYHHDGCDAERCPKCREQLLGCECNFDLLIK